MSFRYPRDGVYGQRGRWQMRVDGERMTVQTVSDRELEDMARRQRAYDLQRLLNAQAYAAGKRYEPFVYWFEVTP